MKRMLGLCSVLVLGSALTMHAQQGARGTIAVPTQGFFAGMPIQARVVKGMPYSAEIVSESIQTLADGNRIVQRSTGRIYRDGEGRLRREEDRLSGTPAISITDPVAGKSFTLDPATRTARETPSMLWDLYNLRGALDQVTYSIAGVELKTETGYVWHYTPVPRGATSSDPARRPRAERLGRGDGGNRPVEEKLPDRVIEGELASGIRRTTTIEKGAIGNERPISIVSEEWTSLALQVLVMTDFSDPRTGRSTYRLLKISRLEPDPALFRVPGDFTVQRPPAAGGRGRGK